MTNMPKQEVAEYSSTGPRSAKRWQSGQLNTVEREEEHQLNNIEDEGNFRQNASKNKQDI